MCSIAPDSKICCRKITLKVKLQNVFSKKTFNISRQNPNLAVCAWIYILSHSCKLSVLIDFQLPLLTSLTAFPPPLISYSALAHCCSPIDLTHLCLLRSRRTGHSSSILQRSFLTLLAFSDEGRCGAGERSMNLRHVCLTLPQLSLDRQWGVGEEAEEEEGEGCSWGCSWALMTVALSDAATLIWTGLSQTMVGVTGPWRPWMRELMNQYWAKWSWSATADSDWPNTAVCQFVCPTHGRRQQSLHIVSLASGK